MKNSKLLMDCTIESRTYNGGFTEEPEGSPILRKNYRSQKKWEKACLKKAKKHFKSLFGVSQIDDVDWTYDKMKKNPNDYCVMFQTTDEYYN